MQEIRFEPAEPGGHGDGVRVFHYLPGEDGCAVSRHWPGLYQDWPEGATPYSAWAVNNCNREEIAVYVGLVWRLTSGLTRWAVPVYYRDEAEQVLGRAPVLVDWEYRTDAEGRTAAERDRGFVPGRAAVPLRPEPTAEQSANAGRAGLFALSSPRDLVGLLHAVLFDACAEITVFGIAPGPGRSDRLAAALRGANRPTVADVLGEDGVLVDLTIGVDLGNADSITVASRTDLGPRLAELTADYRRRIAGYEDAVDGIRDVPAFLRAMPELTGIALDG